MSIFKRIKQDVKNVFVGSHKGDDISEEWFEEPRKNPLDDMPIANGTNRYAPPEKMAELESNPRPEEEIADWFNDTKKKNIEKPDESDEIEEEKTIHQKMYEIATARYNPFSLGGSENCDSDISCNFGGGSEQVIKE